MKPRSLFERALNAVAPMDVRCALCGAEARMLESGLCEDCQGRLCACGEIYQRPAHLEGAYAAFLHREPAENLVHLFKYQGRTDCARILAEAMAPLVRNLPAKNLIMTDVPLHPLRQLTRGFNQAQILARELARRTGLPYEKGLLKRVRNTLHQTGLPAEKRRQNLKDAFIIRDKSRVKDRHIVLIDDVFTTGATVHACAKQLKRGGAKTVWAVTCTAVIVK